MRKFIFVFLLISFSSFSQSENQKIIEGVVYNDNSYSIEGIHVLNITSDEATITDSEGNFKILAHINDELIFSGIQFKRKKIIVDQDIFDSVSLTIYLEEFVNGLNFVNIFKLLSSLVDSKSEEEKLSILPSEALPLILEENFFTDVLKLEFFEVNDFLLQLDLDQEIKQLIIKKNQFLLIDYLLNKSDIYKELRVE